jgi:hypothetical protein
MRRLCYVEDQEPGATVGDEIIQYKAIGPEGKYDTFMGCKRGAWKTHAAAHKESCTDADADLSRRGWAAERWGNSKADKARWTTPKQADRDQPNPRREHRYAACAVCDSTDRTRGRRHRGALAHQYAQADGR